MPSRCRLLCLLGVVSSALAAAPACTPPVASELSCVDDRDCDSAGGFRCDEDTGFCVRARLDAGAIGGDAGTREDAGRLDGGAGVDASIDAGAGSLDGGHAANDGGADRPDASGALDGGEPAADAGADASLPADWWNDEWSARRKLRFHAVEMNLPLADFPVRVPLDRVVTDLGDVAPDGDDLRFLDDDGVTELSYEIVSWGATHEVFVKVPRIERRTDDDFIWLYYKNPGAPAAAAPADVWDADFIAVHHLEEAPSGPLLDSSSGASHPASVANGIQATGLVGRALAVESEPITIPSLDEAAFPQDVATVEMWARGSFSAQPGAALFDSYDAARNQLVLRVSSSGTDVDANAHTSSGTGATVSTTVRDGEWRYLAARLEAGDKGLALFGNRFVEYEPRPVGFAPADQRVRFAAGFVGDIDELRISRVARSDSWLDAQSLAMRDLFLIDGDPEPALPAPARELARTPGELVLYDMNDAADAELLADTSSGTPPLPLTLVAVSSEHPSPLELVGGGLNIRGSPAIVGADAPTRVQEACADQSITVEVWLQLSHELHDGPARIFALAENISRATFVLGQQLKDADREEPHLVFRLTNDATNESGSAHDVEGSAATMPVTPTMLERPTHIVFTWNGSVVEGFVDGHSVVTREWPGSCVADAAHRLALGNDINYQRPWTGTIYLAAVYDGVLSAQEIMDNYAAGP